MALDLESRLLRWLNSAPQNVRMIPTVQIRHSALTQDWFLWREPYAGTIITEDYEEGQCRSCNIAAEVAGTPAHLDQVFRFGIDTTDTSDEFREELDRVPLDSEEPIELIYREYLSDDLTEPQAIARLQAESVVWNRGAALITAASPRFNVLQTGLIYTTRDIPMLRGFL